MSASRAFTVRIALSGLGSLPTSIVSTSALFLTPLQTSKEYLLMPSPALKSKSWPIIITFMGI